MQYLKENFHFYQLSLNTSVIIYCNRNFFLSTHPGFSILSMFAKVSTPGWLNIYSRHNVERIVFQQQNVLHIACLTAAHEKPGDKRQWKWKWEDKKFNGTPRFRLIKI